MKIRPFFLPALFLMLTCCSLFFRNPEITVTDITLSGPRDGGVTIEFHLAVRNPNSYDVTLQGYRYNLEIATVPVAQAEVRDTINFPGKAVTDVLLPVRISFISIIELLQRRLDPEKIPYRLSAGFDMATPLGAISVPVEKSGIFAIPKQFRPDQFLRKLSDIIRQVK
jgi:LEA14-like dessication related protein